MDRSTGTPADFPLLPQPDLSTRLRKIRGILRLGDELHFDTGAQLETNRAECCGLAQEEAQRLVEQFHLVPLPAPHVEHPRSWRAQLESWVVAELRKAEGQDITVNSASTWQPPAGYIGSKSVQMDFAPRSTVEGWEKEDNIEGGPLWGRLKRDPKSREVYYPNDWLADRMARYKPRKNKRS